MPEEVTKRGPFPTLLALVTIVMIGLASSLAQADPVTKKVHRAGLFMGLDPGLSLRLDDTGTPLYARLDLRLGGCISKKLQMGVDWRMDQLVTVVEGASQSRHEIGPVVTLFLIEGWFARAFTHVGGFRPFYITAGAQTGYEFSAGRFGGVGFGVGGDADVPFTGEAPFGYSFSFTLYLTAYNLGIRRGRDPVLAKSPESLRF